MADQQPIDDALLGKFLAGETDPGESARVQQWLVSQADDPEGASQVDFARFERIWQTATPPHQPPIDTDAAWQTVRQKMQASDRQRIDRSDWISRPLSGKRSEPGWYQTAFRIAAVLALVMSFGWLVYQFRFMGHDHPAAHRVTLATNDQKISKTLPDGTTILLNRHSTLEYPTAFANDYRDVILTGEAFFEVTPDAHRPFRIRARQTTVQVLGTSFNVRAYDTNVSVAVRTGKVRFAGGRKAVLLTKNQQATFVASDDTIQRTLNTSANVFAYKTGQLVFENEPLRDVVQILNEVYKADIQLGNERIGGCRLTTRFANAPLDAVVAITAETLGLRVRHVGKQVILDGAGCQN